MAALVKLIGVLIALLGIAFVIYPVGMRKFIAFMVQGKRLYGAGILRLLFGVILLLGARDCRLTGVVMAMGILFLIGGITIFVLKLEKLKSIIEWWQRRPLIAIRGWALVAWTLGALLVYSI